MKKLNLGCGPEVRKGYVNMDRLSLRGVDVVHDLDVFPYPFKDNSFDEVYASHVLEHVDDLIKVMSEIRRISKPGARIVIKGPHFSSGLGYMDPTHKRLFSCFTFDYFTDDCFYGLPRFEVVSRKINFTRLAMTFLNGFANPLINLNQRLYERFYYWLLPASEVIIELRVPHGGK